MKGVLKRLLRDGLDFPEPVLMVLIVAGVMLVFWSLTR